MATGQQRTRKQIRQSIGAIKGLWLDAGMESSPTEASPSAAKIIDSNLAFGGEGDHRGKWLYATDSAGVNYTRSVLESSPSERSIDLSVALPAAPDTDWTYELWEPEVPVTIVHEFIGQSITETDRKGAVALTYEDLHTGGGIRSFGLSSAVQGITRAQYAGSYTGESLSALDTAMDSGSNSAVALTTEDLKTGIAGNVVTIESGASSAETVATATFSALDITGYTHLDIWVKSSVTTTSSGLTILLQEGAAVVETLSLPVLTADTWKRVKLTLSAPELDNAVTKLVLQTGSSDAGAMVVSLQDAVVYRDKSQTWVTIPREYWSIDSDNREFKLDREANVPYAKLLLNGVQKPALLNTDSDICQIDPMYVVNSAAAKIFRMLGDGPQANMYEEMAQQQRARMTSLSGVAWVDD